MNAVVLLLNLTFIHSIRARRLRVSGLVGTSAIALGIFSLGLLLVNFAHQSFGDSWEMIQVVGATVREYWLGGLVAFGAIAVDPNSIVSTQSIDRFFLGTARSLGLKVNMPGIHAEYTQIGRYSDTNVYTIYFSYFKDHGWAGTVLIMFGLGVTLTLLYKRAMRGSPVAVLLFAQMEVGLVLSLHAEHFFNDLNGLIKLLLFLLFLYRVLPSLGSPTARECLVDSSRRRARSARSHAT